MIGKFILMKYLIICASLIICQSCSILIYKIAGLKPNKEISKEHACNLLEDQELICKNLALVNSSAIEKLLMGNSFDSILFKKQVQPLQIHYFKSDFVDVSLINCDVPRNGLSLDWENAIHSKNYNDFEFVYTRNQLEELFKICGQQSDARLFSDELVVIIFSAFMGRQVKVFLEFVNKFISKLPKNTDVIYLNFDNVYI